MEFDFIFEGELIRGDLESLILKHSKTAEQQLQITYIEKIKAPEQERSKQTEQAINSIFYTPKFEDIQDKIYVCHFDGNMIEFDAQLKQVEAKQLLQEQNAFSQNVLTFQNFTHKEKNCFLVNNFMGESFLCRENTSKFLFSTNTAVSAVTKTFFDETIFCGT